MNAPRVLHGPSTRHRLPIDPNKHTYAIAAPDCFLEDGPSSISRVSNLRVHAVQEQQTRAQGYPRWGFELHDLLHRSRYLYLRVLSAVGIAANTASSLLGRTAHQERHARLGRAVTGPYHHGLPGRWGGSHPPRTERLVPEHVVA
jgi:hypothetical protein